MALTLTAKPAAAVYRYTWTPPLAVGDSIASYTLTESGCVIDADELSGYDILLRVSGGAAGDTASILAVVTTGEGETLVETLYIPITGSAVTAGNTVNDVVTFALRPIVGMGEEPDADESLQGLEAFNDMVAEWRIDGLDVGIAGASLVTTVLTIRDEFISALKFNLRVRIADEYGFQLPAATVATAQRGRMLVENAILTMAGLKFDQALQPSKLVTGINDL